jgi:hypothetical protein
MNMGEIVNIKNFNWKTILSILFVLGGLLFWISWGIQYGVWVDIGIYSVAVIFILGGLVGFVLSLREP